MGRGRRDSLRGLVGARAKNRRAQPLIALLCGAALWRGAGRRDADGAVTGASSQGDLRHEGVSQERPALSNRALWDPERCPRWHGRVLRQEMNNMPTLT